MLLPALLQHLSRSWAPSSRQPLSAAMKAATGPPLLLRKALRQEGLQPGPSDANNGHLCFFPSARSWAEDAAGCSSPGDAVGCTCLRLVEVVSAWPCSLRSACARGDQGAQPGCGQELLRQELDRPGKGKREVVQGHVASSCLLLQAPKSLPLRMRKDPPLQPAAGLAASVHSRVCA